MMPLAIFERLTLPALMANSFVSITVGFDPYAKATGMIIAIDTSRCRFLKAV
jgi:hypothetical protein